MVTFLEMIQITILTHLPDYATKTTIAYVLQCTDEKDEHYQELDKMEKELCGFSVDLMVSLTI